MGIINESALREINHEYRSLANKYSKLQKISTLLGTIKKGIFFETLDLKLHRNKYYDSVPSRSFTLNDTSKPIKIDARIAVYMCVIGKYDGIYDPVIQMDNADYYIITDQEIPYGSIWKKIGVDRSLFFGMDNAQINRFYKLHPHTVFKDYDYSIYIDGNIRLLDDVSYIIEAMDKTHKEYGVFAHPDRNCVYTEANYLMRLKRFSGIKNDIHRQIIQYKTDGFPRQFGMYENTILFRKHNSDRVVNLMDEWWTQLKTYTFRDQLSFPYAMWKQGWTEDDLCILGKDLKDCEWVRYYLHS